jgi:hypothetical protein
MLREFKERSSIYDYGSNNDDNKKKTSMFLPNQNEPFQVTDKIWMLFTCLTEDAPGEGEKKTVKQNEFSMRIYVKSKKDRLFLLQVWIFEKKKKKKKKMRHVRC